MKSAVLVLCLLLGLGAPLAALAYTPTDPLYDEQWHTSVIGAPTAWDVVTGHGVIVAVMDAGVAIDHPDLTLNIWRNRGEIADDGIDNEGNGYVDDIHGWNFVNDTPDPRPFVTSNASAAALRHGTAVAGLIAATTNNGEGIAGVAWDARIMSLKVLNERGSGTVDTLVTGINYAVNNGADVINLSLVGYESDPDLQAAINWAYEQGVVVVTAAGNTRTSDKRPVNLNDTPAYPVCYGDNRSNNIVLGVAATDRDNERAAFSSYGASCVDVAAPGEDLISLSLEADDNGETYRPIYGHDWSGTSFATAIVSGVVALVKSQHLDWSSTEIIDVVRDSARSSADHDTTLGAGIINAATAVGAAMTVAPGRLIKTADYPAVYYVSADNTRHLFANEATYWSWYNGTWAQQPITVVTQGVFDELTTGDTVTVRPGTSIVKFSGRDQKYLVGALRQLIPYDASLQQQLGVLPVVEIQPAFEADYERGSQLAADQRLPDGTIITTDARDSFYLIWNGRRRLLTPAAITANRLKTERAVIAPLQAYDSGATLERLDYALTPYH